MILAISLMLVVLVSLPGNGSILVLEDHAHLEQVDGAHPHNMSVGYKTSCDERSNIHCGAKLAVGTQVPDLLHPPIVHRFTHVSLFVLLARVIAQELPPPRT